jgi:hypothetical protein
MSDRNLTQTFYASVNDSIKQVFKQKTSILYSEKHL